MTETKQKDVASAKRRDFLRIAGKTGTSIAATAVVMTAVKPTVAMAAYGGGGHGSGGHGGGGHGGGKGGRYGKIRHKLKLGRKIKTRRGWKLGGHRSRSRKSARRGWRLS